MSMKSQLYYQALRELTAISFMIFTEKVHSMADSSKPRCLCSEAEAAVCYGNADMEKGPKRRWEKIPISFFVNQERQPDSGYQNHHRVPSRRSFRKADCHYLGWGMARFLQEKKKGI